MTLLHKMDMLSIWEIAHRLNNLDPDEQNGSPAEVRDTLRELLSGTRGFFNTYNSSGDPVGSARSRSVNKSLNNQSFVFRFRSTTLNTNGH
jgi:hypothetical protein